MTLPMTRRAVDPKRGGRGNARAISNDDGYASKTKAKKKEVKEAAREAVTEGKAKQTQPKTKRPREEPTSGADSNATAKKKQKKKETEEEERPASESKAVAPPREFSENCGVEKFCVSSSHRVGGGGVAF